MNLEPVAHIHSDFPDKFGIPRQSGLTGNVSEIHFEPEYAVPEAVRGLEEFSHIWLIWQFSENVGKPWTPTVRPPVLGGNTRVGVFATRSPFRPNHLGLSCVRLQSVELRAEGPVLIVAGADLKDGTPIYDIKPYIPYADCRPDASGGFTERASRRLLEIQDDGKLLYKIPEKKREGLLQVLAQDPRPSYQNDPERIYGMRYAGMEIRFRVDENILTLVSVDRDAEADPEL